MGRNLDEDELEDDDLGNCPSKAIARSSSSPRSMLPLLKRVEDLELSMRSLEDRYSPRSVMSPHGGNSWSSSSARSSGISSTSAKKPIQEVLGEIDEKGTLIDRIAQLEDRLGSLNMHLHSGESPVTVLTSPPRKNAAEQVDESHPEEAPPRQSSDGSVAASNPNHHKLKRRPINKMIPNMFKNCLHPVASH